MNRRLLSISILTLIVLATTFQSISAQGYPLEGIFEMPEAIAPPILDQAQEDVNYGFWFDDDMVRWQEFIPTLDNLQEVEVRLSRTGSPGDVIIQIRDGSGSTIIDERTVLESSIPTIGSNWISVDFSQIPYLELIPGNTYRIYVYSTLNSQSPDDRYSWRGFTSSTYCPKCDNDNTPTWPDFDYTFRTYGYGVYRQTVADFDGDRSTDISVYRPSNGKWYIKGEPPVWWGMPGDIPVPGDYDGSGGDRIVDIAVYRPSNGKWFVKDGVTEWWGLPNDVPVQGDYDADGTTEMAVYRPSNGKWYVKGESPIWWGMSGDIPVPGDYDGDGSIDIAVYRPSNGKWYVYGEAGVWWGMPDDIPVPGDYDGDGSTDIAVYRPSNGKWYVYGEAGVWWGMPGDIPVPGDYDGCGDTDIAVLRPSNGKWYIKDQMDVWYYLPDDYPIPVRDTNADGDPYH